ncbi:MAG: endonuclease/exonuclease/phosphatase family protein [Acidobacteria bacterium]|nr:endonuclease/exonuclease/phosphatase family protein [Acidobacteriota bacterium]MBS1866404.1 endonuclease/exonuclease/phosphatase family protein [Acidobacteriota bacterium]
MSYSSTALATTDSAPAVPPRTAETPAFSMASLNLAKQSNPEKIVNAIRTSPGLRDADLYLFQEVRNTGGKVSVAEQAAHKLGHHVSFAPAADGVHDQGLAIMSRYPIMHTDTLPLKSCDLRFRSRRRFALAASVRTPSGDLRVWNVHLDTRINPKERLEQLQPVIDDAARRSGPRLIAGDLNTNGMYWLGNVLPVPCGPAHSIAIRGAMKEHGFDTPFPDGLNTFPRLRRHLDWIFLNQLVPLETETVPVAFSDHNAILVRCQPTEELLAQ